MRTLRRGMRGDDVKALQESLGIKADGIFGPVTEAAVRAFQKEKGLEEDGIAGPLTLGAIGGGDTVIPCEDLKQFSAPHGSMVYGPDKSYTTYKSGGCGVTAFAIVLRACGLCPAHETSSQTIQRLGRYAWEHGYRIKGGGTSAGLFSSCGIKAEKTKSASRITGALRSGRLVILHIGRGYRNGYGGNGHYVVAYGIKGESVLLRDVGSSKASRQRVPLACVTKCMKAAYIMERRN